MSIAIWQNKKKSNSFDLYDDTLEQLLGYSYVHKWLNLKNENPCILDYGCGPGKVASRFVALSKKNIIAVDESKEALIIAQEKRSHENIRYVQIKNDDLTWLHDQSLDAAYLCFVILTLDNESRIKKILSTISRKLKSGAPCIVLDINPRNVGLKFSTFQAGVLGHNYIDGEQRKAWLSPPDKKPFSVGGFYWSEEFYENALSSCGYVEIKKKLPTLKNISIEDLTVLENKYSCIRKLPEWTSAPFIIFKGIKT